MTLPTTSWANAAHACTVEVDVETGMVRILRWIASEDCGVMINPTVVEGQMSGGIVQGIGGVLLEHALYDASGNPLAASFKDYLMPLATDVPVIEYSHVCTPSDTPGGFKGAGEGGAIIAPSTLINAIADALGPFNIACNRLPLSPDRIVMALEAAAGGQGR
jgi:carbon-monoxide dehydrogenase large subunit